MSTKKTSIKRKESQSTVQVNSLTEELVSFFLRKREPLRKQWIASMSIIRLLEGLTPAQVNLESATIYDTCVECLKTGNYESVQLYAEKLSSRAVLTGMTTEQIIGGFLVLRDVYGRGMFEEYQQDIVRLFTLLDIYENVANKILAIVAMAFIDEREKTIRQLQQEAIRELSTPVLPIRERLLILPIIGVLDSVRAKQMTEQLLRSIRTDRAKAVVIDITGVPIVDSKVANHIVQTVEAARLLGAYVILTGISPEIAQTLVAIGVDLSRLNTIIDLRGGIEYADKLLGYKITYTSET